MNEDKKHVTFGFFWMIIGGVLITCSIVAGYLFSEISKVQAQQDIQNSSYTSIQVQLSQIQTDLGWLKQRFQIEGK